MKLLETFVREVVRDEIEKSSKRPSKKTDNTKLSEILGTAPKDKKKLKSVEPIEFSSNSVLNDILNETANNMGQSKLNEDISYSDNLEKEEWPTIPQGQMKSRIMGNNPAMILPDGVPAELVPEPVKKALTKDYTALMKKIKEKKGR